VLKKSSSSIRFFPPLFTVTLLFSLFSSKRRLFDTIDSKIDEAVPVELAMDVIGLCKLELIVSLLVFPKLRLVMVSWYPFVFVLLLWLLSAIKTFGEVLRAIRCAGVTAEFVDNDDELDEVVDDKVDVEELLANGMRDDVISGFLLVTTRACWPAEFGVWLRCTESFVLNMLDDRVASDTDASLVLLVVVDVIDAVVLFVVFDDVDVADMKL
jgi:hypothetical protein